MSKWTVFRDRFTQTFKDAIAAIKARYDNHPDSTGQALGAALQSHTTEITNAVDHMAPVVDAHTDQIAALQQHVAVLVAAAPPPATLPVPTTETELVLQIMGTDRKQWGSETLQQAILAQKLFGATDQAALVKMQAVLAANGWEAPTGVSGDFSLAVANAANTAPGTPIVPLMPAPVPMSAGVVDATGWAPGNVSTDDRLMSSAGGVVVAYRFSAAQFGKQGCIEFSETTPGPQFEISATPGDMSLPLPIPGDEASWLIPARLGAVGDRYPKMPYVTGKDSSSPLDAAILPSPDANGYLYVNVRQTVDSKYLLWYWPQ